jgi:hypothetical protein
MKKLTDQVIITMVLIMLLFSCKKENSPAPEAPKDHSTAFKNTNWAGEITYTNDSVQYYSIRFKEDKTLIWSQFSGDYPGNWGVTGKQLTMTFTASNAIIRADIGDDDRFSNIAVSNTMAYIVNSGWQVKDTIAALEGTKWLGSCYVSTALFPFAVAFLPGSKLELTINGYVKPLTNYSISSSGAFIRYNSGSGAIKNFGVLVSPTEIKGSIGGTSNPWRISKQ